VQKKTPLTAAEKLKLILVGGFEVAIIIAVATAVAMWKIISSPLLPLRCLNTEVSFQNGSKNHQIGGVLPLYRGNDSVIMRSDEGMKVA
jgi:hypothetical protein